jgi:hypothetical protein
MNENKIFYVLELQTYGDGTGSVIPASYPTLREAESKFYQILSFAALSTVYRHGAVLMTEEGFTMKQEVFTHQMETEQAEE